MEFEASRVVTHPASIVLEILIERMEVIVPFLPNVEPIELVERTALPGDRLRILRRWQGAAGSVPRPLRPFLPPALLAWIDTAVWTPAAGRVDWTHATCAAGVAELYDCSGTNFFEPDAAEPTRRTRIRIGGELIVRAERLPGVPAFLTRRIAPQVEAFIVGLITPNLTSLADGLQRYLDGNRS